MALVGGKQTDGGTCSGRWQVLEWKEYLSPCVGFCWIHNRECSELFLRFSIREIGWGRDTSVWWFQDSVPCWFGNGNVYKYSLTHCQKSMTHTLPGLNSMKLLFIGKLQEWSFQTQIQDPTSLAVVVGSIQQQMLHKVKQNFRTKLQ